MHSMFARSDPAAAAQKKLGAAKGILSSMLGVDPNEVVELIRALLDEMREAKAKLDAIHALMSRVEFIEGVLTQSMPEYTAALVEREGVVAQLAEQDAA